MRASRERRSKAEARQDEEKRQEERHDAERHAAGAHAVRARRATGVNRTREGAREGRATHEKKIAAMMMQRIEMLKMKQPPRRRELRCSVAPLETPLSRSIADALIGLLPCTK